MALKQENRSLVVTTPLGKDALVLTAFHGREEMSRLFHYELEMISDDGAIAPADIVGKNVTFSVKLLDDSPRFFNGFISRFYAGDEADGRRNYRAEVVPWLWFLTRTSDCRIFQNKTVVEIIRQIFGDLGFSDYSTAQIGGHHPRRDYSVQYRETDFNFVSRLMEEEGIFYFFRHEDGKHTLVLADRKGAYTDCDESEVDYPHDVGTRALADHITRWEHRYEFRTGKWAQTDYNFQTPSTDLTTTEKTVVKLPGNDKYEHYDYPGEYGTTSDGRPLTKIRMEAEEVEHDVVTAESTCKTFTPGGTFKIKTHRSDSEEGKTFVITSIEHSATEPSGYETGEPIPEDYSNRFTCIPDSVTFRPARTTPRPVIRGVQPAVVVGPSGEEIFPDEYGRVKVQFFWDREGKKDENSSCWIRVSQAYAGQGWGAVCIPRIGQEVLVSFVEGDPDRPLITGRVYNAEQMPPYALPGEMNTSGIKSNSTKGGGGYNEYILDDTKGNELIREHGQYDKDSTIEHDLREHVLNDRSRDVTNNETITIGANRTKSVAANETLNVGQNRSRSVGKNETVAIGLTRTHTVGVNEMINVGAAREVTVGGVQAITVGAAQSINVGADETVSIGGGLSESVGADHQETVGDSLQIKVGKDAAIDVGKNLTLNAGDQIVLKTGKAQIIMKKDGSIKIEGKDILIQGSGKIVAKASGKLVLKGSQITEN